MLGSGEDKARGPAYRGGMERRSTARRLMIEAAALARIEELTAASGGDDRRSRMTNHEETAVPAASKGNRELKAVTRSAWALGDYHRFAKATIWEVGEVLVRACGVSAGQRVLDVAAGTGNTAIRAAKAGAEVVASDLTPENFDAGRREARAHGVDLEWVEGDAEALPFADGEFDVVTSSFGALFAPDHQTVADEMLRVCRPGGTIGMANFTPEGLISDFFAALAPYMPPLPPDALPPALWGREEHVRELFGDRVESLEMTRSEYVERAESPREYRELFKQTFGPVLAIYASLADEPERAAALDRDFLEFAIRTNSGPPGGPAEYRYEYLLVVARRRSAERQAHPAHIGRSLSPAQITPIARPSADPPAPTGEHASEANP
jgi:ubiquinone/menaquinone biosynthesis C-methylase UbiE